MQAVVALALVPAFGAHAQQAIVADDFDADALDLRIWNPLQMRPERYGIQHAVVRSGSGAMMIAVAPGDTDCDGTCQRNELRIANALRLNFGEAAWYGFSFQVRGTLPPGDTTRWVIGQWKEDSGASPFLAQRYTAGVFHITVQDNDCRAVIARSGTTKDAFLKTMTEGTYSDFPFVTDDKTYTCTHAISVEYGDNPILPDPLNAWVDMAYFVKGGRDGSGLIEVWANGRFIARVTGAIGSDDVHGPTQYFKIGMYRDPMPGTATLYFDSFRRGTSRESVDPARLPR